MVAAGPAFELEAVTMDGGAQVSGSKHNAQWGNGFLHVGHDCPQVIHTQKQTPLHDHLARGIAPSPTSRHTVILALLVERADMLPDAGDDEASALAAPPNPNPPMRLAAEEPERPRPREAPNPLVPVQT
jgi:hypothetical protein